jgi:hypothetical protein
MFTIHVHIPAITVNVNVNTGDEAATQAKIDALAKTLKASNDKLAAVVAAHSHETP